MRDSPVVLLLVFVVAVLAAWGVWLLIGGYGGKGRVAARLERLAAGVERFHGSTGRWPETFSEMACDAGCVFLPDDAAQLDVAHRIQRQTATTRAICYGAECVAVP